MNKGQTLAALFTIAMALAVSALAGDKNDAKAMKTPPDAPEGWIVLEENFWVPLAHEPGTYFHRAHEEYLNKDYDLAAIDLRQASAFLRLQTRRLPSSERPEPLYGAAYRLSGLARQVEKRDVKSAAQLDREFARAHCALAEHDYFMAQASWNDKQAYRAGLNLEAAVFNLRSGCSWADADLGQAGFNALADADALADELAAGESKSYEVTTTLEAVHTAIGALEKRINNLPSDPGLTIDEPAVAVAPVIEPGWLLVDEDIWTDLPDSAGRHLHNVYEAYLQRRPEQAAIEIHRAIFDLELQAGRATGDDRATLMSSIDDLEALLAEHNPAHANLGLPRLQFDHTIANACYALARHHCEMAEADWAADLPTLTGYDLKWAANYLDRGHVWADQLNVRAAQDRLRDARSLSDALIAGKADNEKNVASRIESLEEQVMALRDAVIAMAQ
ncbi:MAG: hypothetical protein PVJ57_07485 [Phycisphaerae bacterium]